MKQVFSTTLFVIDGGMTEHVQEGSDGADDELKTELWRCYCGLLSQVLEETPNYRSVKSSEAEVTEIEHELTMEYIEAAQKLKRYRPEYVADALGDWAAFASLKYMNLGQSFPSSTLPEAMKKDLIRKEMISVFESDLTEVWKAKNELKPELLEARRQRKHTRTQNYATYDVGAIVSGKTIDTVELEAFQKLLEAYREVLPLPKSNLTENPSQNTASALRFRD